MGASFSSLRRLGFAASCAEDAATKMNRLLVIGIGTGNPDHLTLQAVKALALVDVVFSFD